MTPLEKLLRAEAASYIEEHEDGPCGLLQRYTESVNPDALSEAWLDNRTTYIWKVGVLSLIDSNKADFARIYIGHHRAPARPVELIGMLNWQDGENDDIGRSLRRYVDTVDGHHPIFEND